MMTAYDLTSKLNGKWHRHYGMAFCPAHNNRRTEALSISDGTDGKLLIHCFAGCTFDDIKEALKDRGLWTANKKLCTSVDIPDVTGAVLKAKRAQKIWDKSISANGTLVEKYLRRRHITAPIPQTLRFNENCYHPSGEYKPAMIARVDWAQHFSIHRTYLDRSGRKAVGDPQKAILGSNAGGHVTLLNRSQDLLMVCEGIETGLSLLSGLIKPYHSLWACLSTSGMKNLRLPQKPSHLCIATDGDNAGGIAGDYLARRAINLGWDVSILSAPKGADFNDVLANTGEIDET